MRANEDSPTGNTLRLSLANRKIPCGFAIFARGMTPAPPMTIAEDGPSSKAPLRVTVITAVKRFGGFQCSRACTRGFRKSVSPGRERQGWANAPCELHRGDFCASETPKTRRTASGRSPIVGRRPLPLKRPFTVKGRFSARGTVGLLCGRGCGISSPLPGDLPHRVERGSDPCA